MSAQITCLAYCWGLSPLFHLLQGAGINYSLFKFTVLWRNIKYRYQIGYQTGSQEQTKTGSNIFRSHIGKAMKLKAVTQEMRRERPSPREPSIRDQTEQAQQTVRTWSIMAPVSGNESDYLRLT